MKYIVILIPTCNLKKNLINKNECWRKSFYGLLLATLLCSVGLAGYWLFLPVGSLMFYNVLSIGSQSISCVKNITLIYLTLSVHIFLTLLFLTNVYSTFFSDCDCQVSSFSICRLQLHHHTSWHHHSRCVETISICLDDNSRLNHVPASKFVVWIDSVQIPWNRSTLQLLYELLQRRIPATPTLDKTQASSGFECRKAYHWILPDTLTHFAFSLPSSWNKLMTAPL